MISPPIICPKQSSIMLLALPRTGRQSMPVTTITTPHIPPVHIHSGYLAISDTGSARLRSAISSTIAMTESATTKLIAAVIYGDLYLRRISPLKLA